MNTQEKNKLIAEFMGLRPHKIEAFFGEIDTPQKTIKRPCYNNSFEWLMEVVEKIETLPDEKFQIEINGKWCNFFDMKTFYNVEFEKAENETKLQNCFEAIVMFIRWYNDRTTEFWEQDFEYLNSPL